jgi:hypothetical protein
MDANYNDPDTWRHAFRTAYFLICGQSVAAAEIWATANSAYREHHQRDPAAAAREVWGDPSARPG